jgi:hypothetical protein
MILFDSRPLSSRGTHLQSCKSMSHLPLIKYPGSLLLAIACFVAEVTLGAQEPLVSQQLVVPQELGNAFGQPGGTPFDQPLSEQVYSSEEFRGLSSDVVGITGISFRSARLASGGSLDIVIPHLTLRMGVFHGAMTELPSRGLVSIVTPPVFQADNLHIQQSPSLDFNINFNFQNPFVYDRREGQLVLQISSDASAGQGAIDIQRVSAERGRFALLTLAESQSII